ncbi:MAG TPA: hypothetical protein DCL74_04445 [Succinivibrionaceae bacterium]|nr:hypothetical protein [Succinivibrionaceae bacterium]
MENQADLKAKMHELAQKSKEVSDIALKGCCAETYELMTELLTQIVAISSKLSKDSILRLNMIIKDLLEAQEKNDLLRISDDLGYELPFFLEQSIC